MSQSLERNPRLGRWIRFLEHHRVRIATGKVELGQGIVTALAQIAAEELDLDLDQVVMLSGSSDDGPDELYTTSSLSIMDSGAAIRLVTAEMRTLLVERAARRLNCAPDDLGIERGHFHLAGERTGQSYWTVTEPGDLEREASGTAPVKPHASYRTVGRSVPRRDLPGKLAGGGFIHDLDEPGMLHARILRQPGYAARLAGVDGIGDHVRIGNFVAVLGDSAHAAEQAAKRARIRWAGVRELDPARVDAYQLLDLPSREHHIGADFADTTHDSELTVSRPYIAHASLGPSCALAQYRDGHLTVWSHGQGMHPLRHSLARALDLASEAISTIHVDGAGCYGHNGADDAALDAALVAMARPGRRVRVAWSREDEFGYEPLGTAMVVRISAAVDDAGRPVDWTTRIWSGPHVNRPGTTSGHLLAREALPDPPPQPVPTDPPLSRGGGATRNAIPLYNVGAHRICWHLVAGTPVRTSALRGLGAVPNVVAIEAFLDMLADAASTDRVEYRLALLEDERAHRVLHEVRDRARRETGQGLGFGFARYKNMAAYAAVAAAVTVDEAVRVEKIWCAADAGLVINPDGALNQLEGGIVQAMSWTLHEEVRFDAHGVASLDWDSYPILRFDEIPEIDAWLTGPRDQPALGVGECTVGPTAAALCNAVADALGVRILDMPLTRDRIVAALLAGDDPAS